MHTVSKDNIYIYIYMGVCVDVSVLCFDVACSVCPSEFHPRLWHNLLETGREVLLRYTQEGVRWTKLIYY